MIIFKAAVLSSWPDCNACVCHYNTRDKIDSSVTRNSWHARTVRTAAVFVYRLRGTTISIGSEFGGGCFTAAYFFFGGGGYMLNFLVGDGD
jgi:hypothetical protein